MILIKYRMMNIDDDGYVETLSLEEAQSYEGIYIIVEEDIQSIDENNIIE
jgi:hypothetical protein